MTKPRRKGQPYSPNSKVHVSEQKSVEDYRGPTRERLLRASGLFEEGDDQTGGKIYTMRESPLDKMRARCAIDQKEYAALLKFKTHWHYAGLEPSCGSVDLNRIFAADPSNFSSMAKTERQHFHRQKYREAVRAMGMITSKIVESVVCFELPLQEAGVELGFSSRYRARVAAADRLRDAGYRLSELWGIG